MPPAVLDEELLGFLKYPEVVIHMAPGGLHFQVCEQEPDDRLNTHPARGQMSVAVDD